MVINNGGVQVSAWRTTSGPSAVKIDVTVDDAKVRQQLDGFDGMERPFALVPFQHDGGPVEWKRFNLSYEGSAFDGREVQDEYSTFNLSEQDCVASQYGVAVGLETNEGVVWAQDFGQNTRVRGAGEP